MCMCVLYIYAYAYMYNPKGTGAKLYSRPRTLASTGAKVPVAPVQSAPMYVCTRGIVPHAYRLIRPGGRGGELPRAALLKERHFRKNVQIDVKMVKFTNLRGKGKLLCKRDKRADNFGRHRPKGAAEGAAQFVTRTILIFLGE